MSSLSVDRIAKSYRGVPALKETSLAVSEGEFITLLGPSGSGKTTLLNLISGLIEPTSGRIVIDTRDVTNVPMNKRELGMVFQSYALFPLMSVRNNVAFPLRVRGYSRADIARLTQEALDAVQLGHLGDRKPAQLSGGQQQRVSLARALVYRPKLILLDEPLGALDKNLRASMQAEIKALQQAHGITMIYVTHDQEEALSMSDRVVILRDGQIEQIGSPEDVYFRPSTLFCANFLGEANTFAGRVVDAKSIAVVETEGGLHLRALNSAGLKVGDLATVVVRPENIRIVENQTTLPLDENELDAMITNTSMIGATVRISAIATLPDGSSQIVNLQVLNRQNARYSGATCKLSWKAADCCVVRAN